ncbi:hypothetical protein [Streptomyces luteogriseus]|uniref:hypothetical protein n=1 Tax=Streptomyces luteogriseus TaxID=68233 RepID=UPI0037A74942
MFVEDLNPATIVYIGTTFDVNGNSRRGWVVYNSNAERINFVREELSGPAASLKEAGYGDLCASTDLLKVTEETWKEASELWRYPASSRKFDNFLAEKLWDSSLSSFQDADLGESETFGWYALFRGYNAILHTNSQGFVSVTVHGSEEETESKWEELEAAYSEFCGDEDEDE